MTTWLKAINRPSGEAFEVNLNSISGAQNVAKLLGPFAVDIETPNFMNPDNNGSPTIEILEGTVIIKAFAVVKTMFDPISGDDSLSLAFLNSPSGFGPSLMNYRAGSFNSPEPGVSHPEGKVWVDTDNVQMCSTIALTDGHIYAAYWPSSGEPTVGEVDVYALVAVPL